MKRIYKRVEPAELGVWRASIRPVGSTPPWSSLPNPPSSEMRAQLADEQFSLCCYCAGTIARGNFHIEHFRPRQSYEALTYDWTNLLASCQGFAGGCESDRRHCGAAKDNWFVEDVTLSPLQAGVDAYFRFPLSGKIFPSKTLAADIYAAVDQTILNLNLNSPSLVERRYAILNLASQDVNNLSEADWVERYLDDHNHQLQEFWPALNYNYNKLWSPVFTT